MIKTKLYLKIFYFILIVLSFMPLLTVLWEYFTEKKITDKFIETELRRIEEIFFYYPGFSLKDTSFYTPDALFLLSENTRHNRIIFRRKEFLSFYPPSYKEILKKRVVLYKNKIWLIRNFEKGYIIAAGYSDYHPVSIQVKKMSTIKLKVFFFSLITLNFLLLSYLVIHLFEGIMRYLGPEEESFAKILKTVFSPPLVEELEQREKEKKLIRIAEGLSALSHEIRNSLASLVVFVKNIESHVKKEEQDIYKNIRKEIEELNQTLSDYQDLVLYEKKELKDIIKIKDLIEDCLKELDFDEEKIKIIKDIQDFEIKGSRILLKKTILNILNNACDAIENKGKIYIKTYKKDNSFFVEIKDTGKGMEKKELYKIREPFFTTKPRGLGLGLFFVDRIVSLHKGRLFVESEVSKGTVVKLEFKL